MINYPSNGDPGNQKARFAKINGYPVIYIDKIPTVIKAHKKGILKGWILEDYMSLRPCFVASFEGFSAHGTSAKEASKAAKDKFLNSKNIEDKILEFKKLFKKNIKYSAQDFFEWHFLLTGSCQLGREDFVKTKNINLKRDKFTPLEFINICKNAYGGEILQRIVYD